MALKYAKSNKKSLAMVVSTPTMTKDQKRKAKGDLSKERRKKKKKSSSARALERNKLYFAEDTAKRGIILISLLGK